MCPQKYLKRRISDRNCNNNDDYDDLRHSKCVKLDDGSICRKLQPRSDFTRLNTEEVYHGINRKLNSRNDHSYYHGNKQEDQNTNKRSTVRFNKNEQHNSNVKFQHNSNTNQQQNISQRDHTYKQQNFSNRDTYKQQNISRRSNAYKPQNFSNRDAYKQQIFSNRDIYKSSVINGKGKWDLACALAYRHLFVEFVAQNEASDSDYSSSSPSTSTSSKCSENSLDLNQRPEDDDGVNFALYLLTSSTTPAATSTVQNLAVLDVVNPTQAAKHWLSVSRGI